MPKRHIRRPTRPKSRKRKGMVRSKRFMGNIVPTFDTSNGIIAKNSISGAVSQRSGGSLGALEDFISARAMSESAGNNWRRLNGNLPQELEIIYNDYYDPTRTETYTCDFKCHGSNDYDTKVYQGTCIHCPENAYKGDNARIEFMDIGFACCGCPNFERDDPEGEWRLNSDYNKDC